jgi:ribosomal protein S16
VTAEQTPVVLVDDVHAGYLPGVNILNGATLTAHHDHPRVDESNGAVPAVAVKIKLKRVGKVHAPQYRVIVADSRTKRDGRAIEEIGIYQPRREPSLIQVDSDRAQYWLGVGAQPTESEEVVSTALGGDWEYRGIRTPSKDLYPSTVEEK